MFLRAHRRTKDGKSHTYFTLVESIRTQRGPRQRIVAELGELSSDDQRRWQRTAIFHSRHQAGKELPSLLDDPGARLPDDPDVVRIRLGKAGWTNARAFGDVWLGLELWRMLGLEQIVSAHVPQGREEVPPATMVAIEVLSRLCIGQGGSTSEFDLAERGYRRTALEDLLGVPDASVTKDGQAYVLARSRQRRLKERAMRRKHLLGLQGDLSKLAASVSAGRLRNADSVQQRLGRLAERWPMAWRFVEPQVDRDEAGRACRVRWSYKKSLLRAALARDGAYLLLSDRTDWTAEQLWATYTQLTRAEDAFRAMKSHLLLRPMWHQSADRIQAHIFVCVLAYALWKSLDHLLARSGLMSPIRKTDDPACPSPKERRMSAAAALQLMHDVQIGDILLETTEGRKLRLRRVARPNAEQRELLAALRLSLPERLSADHDSTDEPPDSAADQSTNRKM